MLFLSLILREISKYTLKYNSIYDEDLWSYTFLYLCIQSIPIQ